jgi:hypothetical protein
MGPLTIQIMILVASFLFYRILKSGFDSWKAILIDFGIVLFLFGLQYYLQKNQNKSSNDSQTMFPAGPLSTFFGTSFPSKIAMDEFINPISARPQESSRYGCYLQLKDHLFMDPKQKKILHFNNKIDTHALLASDDKGTIVCPMSGDHKLHIKESGFYMVQMTCDVDQVPYSAKLSLKGGKMNDQVDKTVHDGENSFIVYLRGGDEIQIELENLKNNIMLQDTTTLYLIKL